MLVVAGTVLAWRIAGSWDALLDSGYGALLLAKVLAALVTGFLVGRSPETAATSVEESAASAGEPVMLGQISAPVRTVTSGCPGGHAASSGCPTVRCGASARRKSGASKAAPAETTPVVRARPVRMRSTASTASGALMA